MVVFASSDPVLSLAQPHISAARIQADPAKELVVKSLTSGILSIRARAGLLAQAENTANAVANGFVEYITSPKSLSGSTGALVLQPASIATGGPLAVSIAIFGAIGPLGRRRARRHRRARCQPARPAAAAARRDSGLHRSPRAGLRHRRPSSRRCRVGEAADRIRADRCGGVAAARRPDFPGNRGLRLGHRGRGDCHSPSCRCDPTPVRWPSGRSWRSSPPRWESALT